MARQDLGPNKATNRVKLRSGLANRRLADIIFEQINANQNALNTALTKLNTDAPAPVVADAEETDITCIADASGSLDGTYFILHEPTGSVAFWIDIDNSGTVEPAHGADRSVEITAIATDAINTAVATAVAAAIQADAGFSASAAGAVVSVINAANGAVDDAEAGTSGFTMNVTQQGADANAGVSTDYEAEAAITDLLDPSAIFASQYRTSIRAALRKNLHHRRLADEMLRALTSFQASFNALLIKLDDQAGALTDADFESTLAVSVIDADGVGIDAQFKAPLRLSLQKALANARLGNRIMDALVGLQESLNAALVKIDAEELLGEMEDIVVEVLDPEATN